MKIIIYISLFISSFTCLAQDNQVMYEKFFPNPAKNIPFPKNYGTSNYYTPYKTVLSFIDSVAAAHPDYITVSSIGASQRGFKIPKVILAKKNNISDSDKIRVTFLASVHGNEPITTDAMLYLMDELTTNKTYSHLLDKIILEIIPIVNVDGHLDDKRESNNETDLNRNLTILDVVETVHLKDEINKFDPHIVIDFHEYNPSRKDYLEINDCFTSSYDAMFLYTGNLNVNHNIRKVINEDFIAPTKMVLTQNNLRVTDYLTTQWVNNKLELNIGGNSARSSATNYALQNRISILMEIRGVNEKEKASKRRIQSSFLCAISYLEIAGKKADLVKKAIHKADQETADKTNDIVLASKPEIVDFPLVFINTCSNEFETVHFNASFNVKQTATETRKRPDGYVIATKSKQVLKILNASGIMYHTTDAPARLEVETFQQMDIKKFDIIKESREIPQGAIVIDESQKMGNLIIELLEPEENNSLVANKLLKPFKGTNTLRIFRINKEQVLQLQNKKQ